MHEDKLVEIVEPVAYMTSGPNWKMATIPAGRLGVVSRCAEDSLEVATVGERGGQLRIWIPMASLRVLKGCKPEALPEDEAVESVPFASLFIAEVHGEETRVMVIPIDQTGHVRGGPHDLEVSGIYSRLGFDWGSEGDGAKELALALLRESVQDLGIPNTERMALVERYHVEFCRNFVNALDRSDRWSITSTNILRRLQEIVESQKMSDAAPT